MNMYPYPRPDVWFDFEILTDLLLNFLTTSYQCISGQTKKLTSKQIRKYFAYLKTTNEKQSYQHY